MYVHILILYNFFDRFYKYIKIGNLLMTIVHRYEFQYEIENNFTLFDFTEPKYNMRVRWIAYFVISL